MSDVSDTNDLSFVDDDPNGPEDRLVTLKRSDIRALEASAKRGKDAEAAQERAEKAERALVFAQAGIDTTTEHGATFMRGYDGELDKDKVAEAAGKFGLISPSNSTPDRPTEGGHTVHDDTGDTLLQPGEADMTGHRAAVSSGAPPDQGVEIHPHDEALRIGQKVIADGGKFEEGWGAAFAYTVGKAQDGDQRVIIPGRSVRAEGGG